MPGPFSLKVLAELSHRKELWNDDTVVSCDCCLQPRERVQKDAGELCRSLVLFAVLHRPHIYILVGR